MKTSSPLAIPMTLKISPFTTDTNSFLRRRFDPLLVTEIQNVMVFFNKNILFELIELKFADFAIEKSIGHGPYIRKSVQNTI
jgi:hypothetical protein